MSLRYPKEPIKFVASEADEGLRIDKFLSNHVRLTHSVICKSLRKKEIFLNGSRVKELSQRVAPKDMVEIFNVTIDPDEDFNTTYNKKAERQKRIKVAASMVSQIRERIMFEDDKIIVINKPFGVATQSGGSLKYSLDDILRTEYGDGAKIVHRLDKDTSGVIVFAKTKPVARQLSDSFKCRSIKKVYLAVVSPIPEEKSGVVTVNMSRLETRKNEHISKVVDDESAEDGGQESTTEYRVLKTNEDINCALVEFVPKTGRTHQIRLHASHIGCPIVGDRKYGGNLQMCKKLNLVAQKILLPSNIHSGWLEVDALPDFFVIQE